MNNLKPAAGIGTDWTRLLSDPDLVRHVGKLLQAYREAPPQKRDEALLAAMREVQAEVSRSAKPGTLAKAESGPTPVIPPPVSPIPPFEPSLFTPNLGDDRRRHPRIPRYVAVELRADKEEAPIGGNVNNTRVGGCLVETATAVKSGAKVEIGLWVANGKISVKGFALSGIVTHSAPTAGVRVRFGKIGRAS